MNDGDPVFVVGDAVVKKTSRDIVGVITTPRFRQNGCWWYRVQFGGRRVAIIEDDLEAFKQAADLRSLVDGGVYASAAALSRRVTLAKLQSPLRDAIYSMNASRTQFHAYQFKPLLKLLGSDTLRLLIADEVGLGKTIEAGYILRELKARSDIDRVLIVCPASLRIKWRTEMALRFGERFDLFTAATFRNWLRDDQSAEGRTRLQGIISLQSLRTENLYTQLEENPLQLDLLIVDEAHHCRNSETHQHQAVRQLTLSSDAIAFLTATPLHIRNTDLYNLLKLLLPEEFDRPGVFEERLRVNQHIVHAETQLRTLDLGRLERAATHLKQASAYPDTFGFTRNRLYQETLSRLSTVDPESLPDLVELQEDLSRLNLISHVFTRTKKRDAYPDAATRDPKVLKVDFSEGERAIYDKVYSFCCEHYSAAIGNWAAQFPLMMLQRQMASSIPAMLQHYSEILQDASPDLVDGGIDDQEDDDDEERPSAGLLDIPGFPQLIRDCHALTDANIDSKVRVLMEVIPSAEKLVLFSYFRGTLRYLERQLTDAGVVCERIDGSVPYNPDNPAEDERSRRIARFRDPKAGVRVLLSSEVGSEGLDFQFCHTLVNWDLPWNPMVVEQRIGRLDRLGQKAKRITIINLSVPGTIEATILNRLYQRVGLFEGAIGPLEPILGDQIKQLTAELFQPNLTPQQQEELIQRRAMALQIRLQEEQALDAASGALLGQDQVFSDRMERVSRLGRYLTPLELEVFARDFLSTEHPECVLRSRYDGPQGRDAGAGCYWMHRSANLRNFVKTRTARLDDPLLLTFLAQYDAEKAVTFDPEVAFEQPTVDHLHNQHPLIKAIASFYADNPDRIPPASRLKLHTDMVVPGVYCFGLADVTEEGLQAGRSVWAEVYSIDREQTLPADKAEQLVHEMVTKGQDWEGFEGPPGPEAIAILDLLQEHIGQRLIDRKRDATRQNGARVDARLASLEASYRAKRRIREQQLAIQVERQNRRVIPLFEAQLARLDAEYEGRRRKLERGREVTVEHEMTAFGFVHIVPEEN